jgi:hypothetical protein
LAIIKCIHYIASKTVKQRSQTYNPKTDQWVKRDTETGRFIDVKQDGTSSKGVRKEK